MPDYKVMLDGRDFTRMLRHGGEMSGMLTSLAIGHCPDEIQQRVIDRVEEMDSDIYKILNGVKYIVDKE